MPLECAPAGGRFGSVSARAEPDVTGWRTEFCLRRLEDGERSRSATEVKQATAVGGDVLVVAGLEAEEAAEFVMASAEPLRRTEALEAAHTSDAAFDAPMILLDSPIANDKSGPARWPGPLASRSGSRPRHR